MNPQKEHQVHIGQVKIGGEGEVLKSLFGSCVGIAFIWKSKKICGLAHCLLPETLTPGSEINGRFVNQAIPSLLQLMQVLPSQYSEIEAIVVGGGNMTAPGHIHPETLVGSINAIVAKKMLQTLKIKVIHEDVGGDEGRKILIDCGDGSFRVQRIPRLGMEKGD